MQTNFFRQIAKMNLSGDLQITLRPTSENSFVLSVLLKNEQCGDDAKKLIPPLNLRGTAEELDNGFFENIATPLQTTSGLMVDMENFMKQLEEVKKKSAMEKEKSEREKKEKETKAKKYKDAFEKVENLEKEGKYKEAWSALPKVSEYPDVTEEIRKKQDMTVRDIGWISGTTSLQGRFYFPQSEPFSNPILKNTKRWKTYHLLPWNLANF